MCKVIKTCGNIQVGDIIMESRKLLAGAMREVWDRKLRGNSEAQCSPLTAGDVQVALQAVGPKLVELKSRMLGR